ncbi:DUF746 domain-containing protein [Paraburkholderia kururiensis]
MTSQPMPFPAPDDVLSGDAAEMVAFLRGVVARLMSPDCGPVPPCPRCGGMKIAKQGYARLGISEAAAGDTVRVLRRWLPGLEPEGRYEAQVRPGGRATAVRAPRLAPDGGDVVEDRLPSATLLADFDGIHSTRHEPLPPCPACGATGARRKGIVRGLPRFQCGRRGVQFNRRAGTPFTRNRIAHRQRRLIRYLALPLPLTQLAAMITARLVREFQRRCAQPDPSGDLASRIRACARPDANTPCLWCGARRVRFDVPGIVPGKCGQCSRLVSLRRQVVERDGLLVAGPWMGVRESSPMAGSAPCALADDCPAAPARRFPS